MRSQWFADNKTDNPQERKTLNDARALGALLIEKIDLCSSEVAKSEIPANYERQAGVLLNLADCVGNAEAYGNAFITARAHNIAAIAIGRLAVNTNFPINTVVALTARLDVPCYRTDISARILDGELGIGFFQTQTSLDDTDESLPTAWRYGVWRLMLSEDKISDKSFIPPWIRQFDSYEKFIDDNIAFFKDGEHAGAKKAADLWSNKWHEKIANGLLPMNIQNIKALVRFRELVGYFPTDVPYEYDTARYGNLTFAAFEYAWRPFRRKEGAIDGRAARTYQAIIKGDFAN